MADWVEGLILGAVQGITEWLPISSEGVLTLIRVQVFGETFGSAISSALWLHAGTLIAAVVYFRHELVRLISRLPQWLFHRPDVDPADGKILDFLFFASLVTGVIGVPLLLLSLNLQWTGQIMTALVGVLLIGTGLFQRFGSPLGRRDSQQLALLDGVVTGIAQGLSILPGLSRSGLTVTTLLLRGFMETDAIRLSFLMSIPVIFGVQILLQILRSADQVAMPSIEFALAGLLSASLVGWLTMAGLVKLARALPFWAFAIFLGLLSFAALLF